MNPTKNTARLAGFLYLILIITGIISLMYVPSKLIVWADAAKTVANIKESQMLFRVGIVSGLICFTCFIFLPLALYQLLEKVNKKYAVAMVLFAVASVPISYISIVNHIDVLTLSSDAEYARVLTAEQLNVQVMLLLESYNNGNLVAHIFWGLWLYPFGYLVYKSGFLPRFLGIMLMLGCFGYLLDFLGYFLYTDYGVSLVSKIIGIPSAIGEFGICLWLLIMGVELDKTDGIAKTS